MDSLLFHSKLYNTLFQGILYHLSLTLLILVSDAILTLEATELNLAILVSLNGSIGLPLLDRKSVV